MDTQQFLQRLNAAPPPLAAGELKSLEQFTEHYPWCGIAQQLLLEAFRQSGEGYSDRQAAKAAAYVVNREHLLQRLQHINVQTAIAEKKTTPQEEEIILDLENETPPAPRVTAPPQPTPVFYNPGDYFSGDNIEPVLSGSDPVSRFLIEKPQLRPVASALSEIDIPNGVEIHEPIPAPVTITAQCFDDIVTETLAKIYEDQGLVSLAMATYEKLSLLEPKKSTYFAARMQNLKFKSKP